MGVYAPHISVGSVDAAPFSAVGTAIYTALWVDAVLFSAVVDATIYTAVRVDAALFTTVGVAAAFYSADRGGCCPLYCGWYGCCLPFIQRLVYVLSVLLLLVWTLTLYNADSVDAALCTAFRVGAALL